MRTCERCGAEFRNTQVRSRFCTRACYLAAHRGEVGFLRHVSKTDGCWLWTGAFGSNGYGCATYQGRRTGAHRAAYRLFVGDVPEGLDVCHRCDNRRCVRPDHLFVGTRRDNMQDCIAKGRFVVTPQQGEKHGKAKLTAVDVQTIRARVASGERRRDVATAYGVSRDTVNDIVNRRTWSHVA